MKTALKSLSTIIALASLIFTSGPASAQVYNFLQSGYPGGGIITGYFVGVDLNSNGQLSSFNGEITDFGLTFSGDPVFGSFTHTFANLSGLVYDIGSGYIGDGTTGDMEGLASNWNMTSGFDYASGPGPNSGSPGGRIIDTATGARIDTREMIAVSDGSAVPEPSTFLLLGAGLGGLAFLRRRKQ
jgi:hypothetical protein